uniref:Uncharacterized protein n=1 Tax=Anguilla anguilla TaxID=7936 RepID=A0A0E9XQ92_ANGAN
MRGEKYCSFNILRMQTCIYAN